MCFCIAILINNNLDCRYPFFLRQQLGHGMYVHLTYVVSCSAKTSTEFRCHLFHSGFEGQSWWASSSMPSRFFPSIYHAMPVFDLLDLHDVREG